MPFSTSPTIPTASQAGDAFFPSGYFAKVPAEALDKLAFEGPHRMEHSEFRLFVALCRFRGRAQVVHPCQETLASMTGMARNNVSRAAHGLQSKGWVRLHHKEANPRKPIVNYELLIPVPGKSPGMAAKPNKAHGEAAPEPSELAQAPATPAELCRVGCAGAGHLTPPPGTDFDAISEADFLGDSPAVDSEPMTADELEAALAQLALLEA
jgi:hypothetical protein